MGVALCHERLDAHGLWGPAVAQLVEGLCYKPESRGFHSRWWHWNFFFITVDINDHQGNFLVGEGGQGLGLTTLPSSFADCLEIWVPEPPGTHRACTGIALPFAHGL